MVTASVIPITAAAIPDTCTSSPAAAYLPPDRGPRHPHR